MRPNGWIANPPQTARLPHMPELYYNRPNKLEGSIVPCEGTYA